MKTTKTAFGTTPENQTVSLFRLENASGAYVEIMDYGWPLPYHEHLCTR